MLCLHKHDRDNAEYTHSLYYRKFCLGACSQAKLMVIQIGSAKCRLCRCDSTNFELVSKFTSYSLYYRKFCLGACSQAKQMVIQTSDATIYCGVATSNLKFNLFKF